MKENISWDQIAVGNFTYPLFRFTTFLDSMVRLGVKNIEVWAAGPHLYLEDATPEMLRRMRREIRARELNPICLTPEQCMYPINIGAEEPWIRDRSVKYFEKGLKASESLGIRQMLVTPGDGYRENESTETKKYTIENLRYLSEKARDYGVTLLLEHLTVETTNLATRANELADLNREIDCDNIIPMVDTDMMSRYGETISDYLNAFDGVIGHVHLVDGMPAGHLALGDGVLPLENYIEELRRVNYNKYISLEISNDRYHLNPEDAVKRSIDWLKKVL
ncbi:MAG: sugar phosphate isomerase/epimerase family protein [Eubacteriales bacterium]|nr:sugar phosphate isomerase/epimerase family protein [Eubacteriales bacterium]